MTPKQQVQRRHPGAASEGLRYGGLASKGGTFMVAWMDATGKENPLYAQFDRVCGLMKKYDAILSLGNGIRAGAIHDSHDRAQMAERYSPAPAVPTTTEVASSRPRVRLMGPAPCEGGAPARRA